MMRHVILLITLIFLNPAFAGADPPDIVLITVDALRADYMGCYGFPHHITPEADRLASEGTLFEDVVTVIGKTGPAFASMFTSRYPPETGVRRNGIRIRSEIITVAEMLKHHGYETGAVISNWVLREKMCGLNRGFDRYNQSFTRRRINLLREKPADDVTKQAIAMLKEFQNRPFFLWVHYTDPHAPYRRHRKFKVSGYTGKERESGGRKRRNYASEVRYTDHWVGVLLKELDRMADRDNMVIFFSSDHGESLGEHDCWGHGKNVLQPGLKIPLIVKGPRWPAGHRVAVPVSIIDFMPTLLLEAGIDLPAMLQGTPLQDYLNDASHMSRRRFAFADRGLARFRHEPRTQHEDPRSMCIIADNTKLIYNFDTQTYQFFDLVSDPGELQSEYTEAREDIQALKTELDTFYETLPKHSADLDPELSPEDLRQLENLGYMEE
jgi:arylsulfatase A-like enzyme